MILSNIRVTYSGFIAFGASVFSSVTGLIFVIIVTRQLEPEDFGLWTLIGSLVAYIAILHPIIGYWTTREIARGEKVGRTSIFSSGFLSGVGFLIYSGIAIYVSYSLEADLLVLMLASILVPISFLNNTLGSICLGFKPQAVSYGTVAFELGKLPVGFLLVYVMQLEIIGVLITLILATFMRTIVLMVLGKTQIIGKIRFDLIKMWMRLSWLPIYQKAAYILRRLDVLIISFATGSFMGLAFWGASLAISNIIIHSQLIFQGLYPKLLAAGKKEFAEESLKRTLFFAIPLLGASIIFAKPGLHILNPLYVDAVPVVILLSITTFLSSIREFFYKILFGYENVDIDKKASFRDYIKSKLFFVPTLEYVFTGSYIAILLVFIILLQSNEFSEILVVIIWSMILLLTSIPVTIYCFIIVKKEYSISIPIKEVTKYSLVTIFASIITFLLIENTLTYHDSIFDFLPELIPIMLISGIIYFGLIYVVDKPTRKLYMNILNEFKKKSD